MTAVQYSTHVARRWFVAMSTPLILVFTFVAALIAPSQPQILKVGKVYTLQGITNVAHADSPPLITSCSGCAGDNTNVHGAGCSGSAGGCCSSAGSGSCSTSGAGCSGAGSAR